MRTAGRREEGSTRPHHNQAVKGKCCVSFYCSESWLDREVITPAASISHPTQRDSHQRTGDSGLAFWLLRPLLSLLQQQEGLDHCVVNRGSSSEAKPGGPHCPGVCTTSWENLSGRGALWGEGRRESTCLSGSRDQKVGYSSTLNCPVYSSSSTSYA